MKTVHRIKIVRSSAAFALASTGVVVASSSSRVDAAGCSLPKGNQVFIQRAPIVADRLGVMGRIRRGPITFSTPGCNYDFGDPVVYTVHMRAVNNPDVIQTEVGFSQRLNSDGRRFFKSFAEFQPRNAGTIYHNFRDPNLDPNGGGFGTAPCTQSVDVTKFTTFKVVQFAETAVGSNFWKWRSLIDCENGLGLLVLDEFQAKGFKVGQAMSEYEVKNSRVEYTGQFDALYAKSPASGNPFEVWPDLACGGKITGEYWSRWDVKISGQAWKLDTTGTAICP